MGKSWKDSGSRDHRNPEKFKRTGKKKEFYYEDEHYPRQDPVQQPQNTPPQDNTDKSA